MFKLIHLGFLLGTTILLSLSCQREIESEEALYPLSDPENRGDWILNEAISDEFEGSELDPGKWFVQGTDGEYYIWKGRAPSQFAPHNVRIEDGKLKIRSQWEPQFSFASQEQDGRKYENITTAGVICQKKFLYGYMEIKCRAGDAAMTSSFWTTGYHSELDMFEQMGAVLSSTRPQTLRSTALASVNCNYGQRMIRGPISPIHWPFPVK